MPANTNFILIASSFAIQYDFPFSHARVSLGVTPLLALRHSLLSPCRCRIIDIITLLPIIPCCDPTPFFPVRKFHLLPALRAGGLLPALVGCAAAKRTAREKAHERSFNPNLFFLNANSQREQLLLQLELEPFTPNDFSLNPNNFSINANLYSVLSST